MRTLGIRTMDGYDVAGSYQPHFNWQFSATSGDELAAFKATQGIGFKDKWFDWNRTVTTQLAFRYRGLYAWITPGVNIASQLAYFEAVVGDLQPGEFIQLDEEQAPLSLDECVQACELFSARYPGRVAHYGGAFFGGYGHVHPRLRKWPWWMAWYGRVTMPQVQFEPTIWQWGGSDVVGFGSVDSNQIIDRPGLEALAGYGATPPAKETNVVRFVRVDGTDPVWLSSNAATLTWMQSPAELAAKKFILGWSPDDTEHVVANKTDLLTWGVPVGRMPDGWAW